MIAISNLTKHYGQQTLFEGVSLQFNPGQRYGVVGANGCGKSTLLKILSGEESASDGDLSIPRRAVVGVLRQDHFEYEKERIRDIVMMGRAKLWEAFAEREQILARADEHFDGERYAELEDFIVQHDGYALEARAGEVLEGLGIASEVHEQPLSTLSGGFKLRVLLAQVLASKPDVLLLDEPTNHLDILSIRWLEKFLEDYPGTALIVSHDHRFLDNVATTIVDVDYATIKAYPGNYEAFVAAKAQERDRREKEIEKQESKIAEQRAFVERFRAKASKARQAQSKLKAIERIDVQELPRSSRRFPKFRFTQRRPSGREVLAIEGVSKSFGGNQVLRDVDLTVLRGERVAIIGPNGIGKSTLLKATVGDLQADSGEIRWGYEAHPGYVAQDHKAQLGAHAQSVEAWLANRCPGETVGFVRNNLAAVLFSGDEAEKKISALSGGEAARLIFAQHVVEKPNVLVLDEPTNHLDLEAIEALVKALREYEGTLLFVSHDRWFVGQLATRVVEISDSGIRDFPGSYEEYIERCGDDHLDRQAVLRQARATKRDHKADKRKDRGKQPGGSPQRQRKRIELELEQVTTKIEAAEARLSELNELFCQPEFFQETPPEERTELENEHRNLGEAVSGHMASWERLEAELSKLPKVDAS